MHSTYFKDVDLTVRTEGIESLGLTIEVPYNRVESLGDYVIRNNGSHTVNGFRVVFETRKKRGNGLGQNGEILNRISAQIPSWVYDEDLHPWTKEMYHRVGGGAIPPGAAKYCGLGRGAQMVTADNPPPMSPKSENFPDFKDYEEIVVRLDAVMLADDGKIYGPNRKILTRNGTYANYEQTIANHVADRAWAQSVSVTNSDGGEKGEDHEKY
ncbi:MAG: hypothetical protein ACJ754_01710 [Pyrinomonadaceae bacterium]